MSSLLITLLVAGGIDSVISQGGACTGELAGVHAYRALFGVNVHRLEGAPLF